MTALLLSIAALLLRLSFLSSYLTYNLLPSHLVKLDPRYFSFPGQAIYQLHNH